MNTIENCVYGVSSWRPEKYPNTMDGTEVNIEMQSEEV